MRILDKDRIGALIVFAFCASAWTFLDDMPGEAAFFPRAILVMAMVLSVIWGVSAFSSKQAAPDEAHAEDASHADHPFIENPGNFTVFLACLIGYVALIGIIGYFTASALFVVSASLLLGYRRPLVVVLTAAGFVFFIYVVFVLIFNRPLPLEFFQPR